jgi:epoxyqueuosine reductase
MTLHDEIRTHAAGLGFHKIGFARAGELAEPFSHYEAFVEARLHGEMHWLAEHAPVRRRLDHAPILAGARSVIVCALAYHRSDDEKRGPAGATVARYARGRDYHGFFRKRLKKLARWLEERVPGSAARAIVDTAPVLERAWAQEAGVGFVGKNGMLIVPGLGSYVLLGEVISTVELDADEPLTSRCGSCTRCLEACPTDAFVRPFVLDARRCVSYLTIELRGAIPVELREGVGDRVFGCDVCQEVCPYNRTALPDASTTVEFAPDARVRDLDVGDLVAMDDARFRALTEGSPLARAGRAGMVRNALVVIANTRARTHLPVVRSCATSDPDAMVRETAAWALTRLE